MDPELVQLARALDELTRRVERLEQILRKEPAQPDRPYLVTKQAERASLESRLGSQYLNRAGVIALLVGIAFFLHWAFTNNWIGPLAVVILGIVGGLALFALGEWFLHRTYRIFGLSLEGLGIAALFLTLWAAFQMYQLIPALVAFFGMVLLTGATAVAALARNSEALAIFAAIGGFGTPLLLATGRDLESQLFTYVLVLCLGILATLRFRSWMGLLLTGFLGAVTDSVVWFAGYYGKSEQLDTLLFFSALLAIFMAAPVLMRTESVAGRNAIALVVPIGAALAFLLGTNAILASDEFTWTAQIMATSLLIVTWRWCPDRLRPTYFAIAIAASAVSIPVSVSEHWITSAIWLAYGVVLMLFGLAKKLVFVRWVALVLIGITIVKVFLIDLSSLGQGYRILALSVLGIALLSLSFLYQRNWLGMKMGSKQ